MAEQLGLVTTKPPDLRREGCVSISWMRGACGLGGRNRHFGDVRGDSSFQAPARSFSVRPTFRTVGRGEPCDFEPRMTTQHLDETLADDAGCTEDSYRKFV